jgi:ABC-type polysaccharide/polyol phosphate export permease
LLRNGRGDFPDLAEDKRARLVSRLNPLTHVVDALRTCMRAGSTSNFGPGFDDVAISFVATILVFPGARLYPRLATQIANGNGCWN